MTMKAPPPADSVMTARNLGLTEQKVESQEDFETLTLWHWSFFQAVPNTFLNFEALTTRWDILVMETNSTQDKTVHDDSHHLPDINLNLKSRNGNFPLKNSELIYCYSVWTGELWLPKPDIKIAMNLTDPITSVIDMWSIRINTHTSKIFFQKTIFAIENKNQKNYLL